MKLFYICLALSLTLAQSALVSAQSLESDPIPENRAIKSSSTQEFVIRSDSEIARVDVPVNYQVQTSELMCKEAKPIKFEIVLELSEVQSPEMHLIENENQGQQSEAITTQKFTSL